MFIVVDCETTGLDHNQDYLLEVGMVATDNDLKEIDRIRVLILLDGPWEARMDDVCRAMHTKNGLIVDVLAFGLPIKHAAMTLKLWLSKYESVPMTGSTIDFDRAFLRRLMRIVEERFHYRSINVSTIKEITRLWAPELAYPPIDPDLKAHRAIPDALETIEELKYYRPFFEDAVKLHNLRIALWGTQ